MTLLRVHGNTYVALFVIYCRRLDICNVLYLRCSHTVGDAWSLSCRVYTQSYFMVTACVAWWKYFAAHWLKGFFLSKIVLELSVEKYVKTKEAARSLKCCNDPRHSALHAFFLFVMFVASLWIVNSCLLETHSWLFCFNPCNAYYLFFIHSFRI